MKVLRLLLLLWPSAAIAMQHNQPALPKPDDDEGRRLIAEMMSSIVGLSRPSSSSSASAGFSRTGGRSHAEHHIPQYVVELGYSLSDRTGNRTNTSAELDAALVEKGAAATVFVAETSQQATEQSRPKMASVNFKVPLSDFHDPISSASLRLFLHQLSETETGTLEVDLVLDDNGNAPIPVIEMPTEATQPGKWLIINVTTAIQIWTNYHSSAIKRASRDEGRKLEFVVSFKGTDRNQETLLDIHRLMLFEDDFLPTLTTFKQGSFASPSSISQELRLRLWQYFHNQKRTRRSAPAAPNNRWSAAARRHCQLHPFRIEMATFNEQTQSNVVSPLFLDFNICLGHCNLPLIGNSNASSNAIVRSLVKVKRPAEMISEVACCPVDFDYVDLVVMQHYFKGEFQYNTIRFKDLLATSCGCR